MTDQAKLRLESPFWSKKLDRAIRVRDVDKDGVITRKDFEIIAQRYKDLGGISGEQLQRIRESLMKMCDSVGLIDNTKQFTYEEFKRHHANFDNDPSIPQGKFFKFDALRSLLWPFLDPYLQLLAGWILIQFGTSTCVEYYYYEKHANNRRRYYS